ncbi:hypothetical protein GF406_16375 [candidate division KSB1 bacterium]|nr:hypothetical protein [candidate division KSB1 bacterium]
MLKAIAQINLEISQIDDLLASYDHLFARTNQNEFNLVEITALASVLHSFYNGIENIFLCIAKRIDHDVPHNDRWHRDLLLSMGKPTKTRPAVLSMTILAKLTDYMAFRHYYRHSYSYTLEWGELRTLVTPLKPLWQDTRKELLLFLSKIS